MVKFLVLQIKLGKIKLSDVPEKWKKEVENALGNDQHRIEYDCKSQETLRQGKFMGEQVSYKEVADSNPAQVTMD